LVIKYVVPIVLVLLSSAALAQDYQAVTTTNAIVRQAPGAGYEQIGAIPAGTPVSVEICFDRGAFCMIDSPAIKGFVAGDLLSVGKSGQTVKDAEASKWASIDASPKSSLPDYEAQNIVVWGDSLSTNTFGDELEGLLVGRRVAMQGVPGEDGRQIAARMLASTTFDKRIKVIWDRHYNGETPAAYMADLAPVVEKAAKAGPFVIVSDVADLDGTDTVTASADASETAAINAALRSKYPDNYLDMTGPLADPATRRDGLHLTPAGEKAVAKAIADYLQLKGL
jgi:uncharacterized protein YraI